MRLTLMGIALAFSSPLDNDSMPRRLTGYVMTNSSIRTAVDAWLSGDTATYGHISTWETGAVTDMAYLFCGSQYRLNTIPARPPRLLRRVAGPLEPTRASVGSTAAPRTMMIVVATTTGVVRGRAHAVRGSQRTHCQPAAGHVACSLSSPRSLTYDATRPRRPSTRTSARGTLGVTRMDYMLPLSRPLTRHRRVGHL